jgi:esterase/lipase superfamily enzyme
MNLSPIAYAAILAAVGLLLYAFLWWVTKDLPRTAKIISRAALTLVVLLPIVLGAFFGAQMPAQMAQQREPKSTAEGPRIEEERRRQVEVERLQRELAARKADEQAGRIAREAARREAPRLESAVPPESAPRAPETTVPPPAGATPPPPMAAPPPGTREIVGPTAPPPPVTMAPPVAMSRPPAAANGTPRKSTAGEAAPTAPPAAANGERARPASEPPAAAAPAAPEADWDVVPVYYGTDRAKSSDSPRVDYGSERGRRLALGHALVTVPKSHQVPQVERPWVYTIPFTSIVIWREAEDPKKHFTMKEVHELTRAEFIELVRKRLQDSKDYKDHALVFVHGFNTSFEFAIYRTAQIAYDLKFDGAPFVYSWPSKGQLGAQDYRYDRESATAAEPYLKQFLELVAHETGAKNLSIIAHSMGNQLLLPVLRDLKRSTPPGVEISQVILAAPDVDRDNFDFLAREIQGISKGVTLFAASNDRALMASRQHWGGVPRAGDVPPEGPVIVPGVDTIDVTAINTELLSLNHSGYAEKTALLDDIRELIRTGKRPPKERVPVLDVVTTANGQFWRYPAPR